MTVLTKGTVLLDDNRDEFVVSYASTRIVVISRASSGNFVESVTHDFALRKYRVK